MFFFLLKTFFGDVTRFSVLSYISNDCLVSSTNFSASFLTQFVCYDFADSLFTRELQNNCKTIHKNQCNTGMVIRISLLEPSCTTSLPLLGIRAASALSTRASPVGQFLIWPLVFIIRNCATNDLREIDKKMHPVPTSFSHFVTNNE